MKIDSSKNIESTTQSAECGIKPPVLIFKPGRIVTDQEIQLPFWLKFRVIGAPVSPSPLATPVKWPWKSPASLDATCALHMVRRQAATDRDSRIIPRISTSPI